MMRNIYILLTITLPNMPGGIFFQQIMLQLTPQGRGTAKHHPDMRQVKLVALVLVGSHVDEDRGRDIELLNLEALESCEVGVELEAGEQDDLVAAVLAEEGDECEGVDVAEGQNAEGHLGGDTELEARDSFEYGGLENVGYDVAVRYHDGFLFSVLGMRSRT